MIAPPMPDIVVERGSCTRPGVDLSPWLEPHKTTNTAAWRVEVAACGACPAVVILACRRWISAAGLEFQGTVQGAWAAPAHRGPSAPPWDPKTGLGYPLPEDRAERFAPGEERRRRNAAAPVEEASRWERLSDAARAHATARIKARLAALPEDEKARRRERANRIRREKRAKAKETGE